MNRENVLKNLAQYYYEQPKVLFGYLFGSYAQAINHENSDIDIGIYLKESDPEFLLDYRLREIDKLQKIFGRTIDLVIINQAPPLLKHEIFRHGILLINRDNAFLVQYRVGSFYQYLDQAYITNRYFETNKAKIQGGDSRW